MVVQCGLDCAVWYRCWIAGPQDQCSLWFSSSLSIFLSGWQDGARKGGRSLLPVEAEKLGSGSFLQVVACKSRGRSLLPVEAGKIEVYIIREMFHSSSYFWTTIIKKASVVFPPGLGFPHKNIMYCVALLSM